MLNLFPSKRPHPHHRLKLNVSNCRYFLQNSDEGMAHKLRYDLANAQLYLMNDITCSQLRASDMTPTLNGTSIKGHPQHCKC